VIVTKQWSLKAQHKNLYMVGFKHTMMGGTISINADGADNSTLLHLIQAAYKKGKDRITINFSDRELIDYKKGSTEDIQGICERTVQRLYGMKITGSGTNSIVLEYQGAGSYNTVNIVLDQIFDTLLILSEEVFVRSRTDPDVLRYTKDRHDVLTKFVAFCLRLINTMPTNNAALYHMLSLIDKLVDVLKYTGKEIKSFGTYSINSVSEKSSDRLLVYDIGAKVHECIILFKEYFDNPEDKKLFVNFSRARREIRSAVEKGHYSSEETEILMQWVGGTDLLLECFETIALTSSSQPN